MTDICYDSSDTDGESDCSVTNTQLAISDGPVEDDDNTNPLVSRIGGRIAWLPASRIPSQSIAQCSSCSKDMPLLVQIFAPLDDSEYDRILLVWACPRASCQAPKQRCIKAIRMLSHNPRWAAKLAAKRKRQEAKQARIAKNEAERNARQAREEEQRKVNPFAVSNGSTALASGGLGASLFGNLSEPADSEVESLQLASENESEENSEEEDARLAEELAVKTSLQSSRSAWKGSDWSREVLAYEPAEYLSTFPEPVTSVQERAKENKAQMQKVKENGGINNIKGWEAEKYESMMTAEVDAVFERFVQRVRKHGKQLVRYEFAGTPVAFHGKGSVYDLLWSAKSGGTQLAGRDAKIVSGGAFAATPTGSSSERSFSSKNVPKCPRCRANRIFELQLMPNLVNTLRPNKVNSNEGTAEPHSQDSKVSAEDRRRREIEEVLGRRLPSETGTNETGQTQVDGASALSDQRFVDIRWNTAFVFVCEKDCYDDAQPWSEEIVYLQSEDDVTV